MESSILEIDIHDRVFEAYYGLMGENMMTKTQQRIHWICSQVKGIDVLDVGCSQGILPLLLGREGKKVIGLDISSKAIAEAKEHLEKEEIHTKENIDFLHANFMMYDFGDKKYDTIIIAEVLEHLTNPQEFISKAATLLKENGKLIITVPFGINDFIDHKQTFYLLEPLKMINNEFTVKDISILGKWIGIVANFTTTKNKEEMSVNSIKYLKLLEKSFFDIERQLIDDLGKKRSQIIKLKENNDINISKLEQSKKEKDELQKEYENKLEQREKEKEELQKEYENKLEERKKSNKKNDNLKIIKEKNEELETYRQKNKYLRTTIDNFKRKINKSNSMKEIITTKYYEVLDSTSYKFGHLLLHETRSLKALLSLPKNIVQIGKESKEKIENHNSSLSDTTNHFSLNSFENQIQKIENENELEIYIEQILQKNIKYNNSICKKVFSTLKDTHTDIATKYGILYADKNLNDVRFLKVLAYRLKHINEHEKSYTYLKHIFSMTKEQKLMQDILEYEYKDSINDWINLFNNGKNSELNNIITTIQNSNKNSEDQVYKMFANIFTDIDVELSINFINKALEYKSSTDLYLKLFDLYIRKGALKYAINSIPLDLNNDTAILKKTRWLENLDLINMSFPFPENSYSEKQNLSNKVFYLLHNSLPYHSGGYATRAHGLMKGVNSLKDFEMMGVSRLGYPKDILKLASFSNIPDIDNIDNNKYMRLKSEDRPGSLSYIDYVTHYAEAIEKKFAKEKPFIIHAASNFYNGLAAVYAAKKLGIKSIYEIRGLWEITRISREPKFQNTEMFELNKKMETEAAKNADVVITITEALKTEIIQRGVEERKIHVIPNGVDTNRFIPLKRDETLADELNIKDKIVIGYIGSIVQYEGLEYLVEAVKILVNKNIRNLVVLIVGDGAVLEEIQELVKSYNLSEYFNFTGRVPHEEVEKYYSIVDIAPFPRKGLPVTEMVSPLKPFEAMAMEKAVISSDVEALKEIVNDGYNGLTFKKDDIVDFSNNLEKLIRDKNLRIKLGKQARNWVIENRDWKILAQKVNDIYQSIL